LIVATILHLHANGLPIFLDFSRKSSDKSNEISSIFVCCDKIRLGITNLFMQPFA